MLLDPLAKHAVLEAAASARHLGIFAYGQVREGGEGDSDEETYGQLITPQPRQTSDACARMSTRPGLALLI
eukprot:scaffold109010_cov34-Tisochrysis_lutea.AAC.2